MSAELQRAFVKGRLVHDVLYKQPVQRLLVVLRRQGPSMAAAHRLFRVRSVGHAPHLNALTDTAKFSRLYSTTKAYDQWRIHGGGAKGAIAAKTCDHRLQYYGASTHIKINSGRASPRTPLGGYSAPQTPKLVGRGWLPLPTNCIPASALWASSFGPSGLAALLAP